MRFDPPRIGWQHELRPHGVEEGPGWPGGSREGPFEAASPGQSEEPGNQRG